MMTGVPLILDSTVYKQTPQLSSGLFPLLRRQCRIGTFRVYLPEVIEREYLTWIEQHVEEAQGAVVRAIQSLDRFAAHKKTVGFDLLSHIAGVEMNDRKMQTIRNWEEFKKDANVIDVPIASHHGSQVMKAYFAGDRPFSSRKNRDDLPDAFALAAILDVVEREHKAYFVTKDKRFATSLDGVDNVIVLPDLATLFERSEIAESMGAIFSDNMVQTIKNILLYYQDEVMPKFSLAIREEVQVSELVSQLLESYMANPEPFPNVTVQELKLTTDNTRAITPNVFMIPFSARFQVELAYRIEASDLECFDKQRVKRLINRDEVDFGYYDVVEGFPFAATGQFSFGISDADPTTWKDPRNEVTIKIEIMESKSM